MPNSCNTLGDFLALEFTQNVALECAFAAEETLFGQSQGLTMGDFLLKKSDRAYKIGQLKKLVLRRLDILGELNTWQRHR